MKSWYESKTIWGSIITLGMAVIGFFGLDASLIDEAALADNLVMIGVAIGGLLTMYGRLTTTKQIR